MSKLCEQIIGALESDFSIRELNDSDLKVSKKAIEIKNKKGLFKHKIDVIFTADVCDDNAVLNEIGKILDKEKMPRPSIIWIKESSHSNEELMLFNDKYLTFIHIINIAGNDVKYSLDFHYEGAKHIKKAMEIIIEELQNL